MKFELNCWLVCSECGAILYPLWFVNRYLYCHPTDTKCVNYGKKFQVEMPKVEAREIIPA